MKKWMQNLTTRCIAFSPIVSVIGGPAGARWLIIVASVSLKMMFDFPIYSVIEIVNDNRNSAKLV